MTSRNRLGWGGKDCQDLLCGKIQSLPRFTLQKILPLKLQGSAYKSCVRSAMLYGSETWCLGHNEVGILQRTERAMVRSMCGVKLIDYKSTKDLMQMLHMNETMAQLARANSVR